MRKALKLKARQRLTYEFCEERPLKLPIETTIALARETHEDLLQMAELLLRGHKPPKLSAEPENCDAALRGWEALRIKEPSPVAGKRSWPRPGIVSSVGRGLLKCSFCPAETRNTTFYKILRFYSVGQLFRTIRPVIVK